MNEQDEIRYKMTKDLSKCIFEVLMYDNEIDSDTVIDCKNMGITHE